MTARKLFSFPNPVNELSARLVAGGVVIMAVAAIVFGQFWLLIPLAYGFVARVLTGPHQPTLLDLLGFTPPYGWCRGCSPFASGDGRFRRYVGRRSRPASDYERRRTLAGRPRCTRR
jgi:hypothetical protein